MLMVSRFRSFTDIKAISQEFSKMIYTTLFTVSVNFGGPRYVVFISDICN